MIERLADRLRENPNGMGMSHRSHGIAIILEWIFAALVYLTFVLMPQADAAAHTALKNADPVKEYYFEALPIIFLAALLYYWDRRQYRDAHIAALAPIIVPLTAWGFVGMTDIIAAVCYNLLI
jgi:hypothetical protein